MLLTNEMNLPQPFVDAVTRDYHYTPKRYSVTSLLKGTREAILQRRHNDEVTTDVSDMIWLLFGTAVHGILEKAQETYSQLKENKIEMQMPNGYTLSGIFDLYDDSTGIVTDYKTATTFKSDWDDYRTQLLIYCYMLRDMGFDAHTGEVVAILKDHSKSKAKYDSSYPQHPVVIKRWEFTEADFDDIGMWLQMRFEEIEAAEQLEDDELPVCSPDDRWYSGEKWAVKKVGNKKAQKLFDNEEDARKYAELQEVGSKYRFEVEHREGVSRKCEDYCSVKEFCNFYKSNANKKL